MKNYFNIVIQLMNILFALIPNLAYPLIFGLDYHGEFLLLMAMPTLAVYMVSIPYLNLLMKEMASKPNLSLVTCVRKLLWQNLILANMLFALLVFLFPPNKLLLQFFFLNSAGVTSFFLAALYADNRKSRLAIYLTGLVLVSLAIALFMAVGGYSPQILLTAVAVVNFISAVVAILFLRERWHGEEKLVVQPVRIARFMGMSSAMGMLSYGVVALASGFLPASRLSLLRIAISVAQAATTFFPVNQRTILENIVSLTTRPGRTDELREYLGAALWLVAVLALGVTSVTLLAFVLADYGLLPRIMADVVVYYRREIILMAPAVPLFLLASILEKTVIGVLSETRGLIYGLVATFLVVLGSVFFVVYTPAGGFAAYTFSSAAVVVIAMLSLKCSNADILRPIMTVLVLIAFGVLMTVWPVSAWGGGLFALIVVVFVVAFLIFYLWTNERDAIFDFIKR